MRKEEKERDEQMRTKTAKKKMIEALTKSLWIVTTACKEAWVWRTNHYEWLANDPEYKKTVEDIAEQVIDFAESALYKNVRDGKEISTLFYLKTKGRKRGYIEKQDVEHSWSLDLVDVSKMTDEERMLYIKNKLQIQ